MKIINVSYSRPGLRSLVCGLAAATLAGNVALAMPYATSLTNNGGVISFRLNEAADNVKVIWNDGGNPTTNALGPRGKGLTVTNLGVSGTFYVQVNKTGDGNIATNSPVIAFGTPRGVAVNKNPASPYFGRVYVSNSATNANNKGDGIFIFNSDLSDTFGQGRVPRNGGITNFSVGGVSSPYRLTVGEKDDRVYICDWSDAAGNLYSTDPDVAPGTVQYPLTPLTTNFWGTNIQAATDAGRPVGTNNNHGSLAAAVVYGSLADGNLTIFTVDEDLQANREDTSPFQMNSLWRYDVGAGPLPYADFQTNLLFTPNVQFVSQTMDLARGPNGYLYVGQYRSAGGQPGVYIITNGFTANMEAWNSPNVWNSRSASLALGESADILLATGAISVSPDGRMLAHLNIENNRVTVVRLTNGIPDLTRRYQYTGFGTTASARGIAFDAADNLYVLSQGIGTFQALTLGLTATATTGSDGTFVLDVPQIVSVAASDAYAHEETPSFETGTFTFTREGDTSAALTLNYTISGTAGNGVDYDTIPASVTFAPGASTTNVTITPVDDALREAVETVTLTITPSADYSVLEGRAATAIVADNETPEISLEPVYTTMYERIAADYVRFTVRRLGGETNSAFSVNIGYSGALVPGTDYNAPGAVLNPGDMTYNMDLTPIDNAAVQGLRTGGVQLDPPFGTEYIINATNNAATFNIVDDDLPAETPIWSETFDTPEPQDTLPATWIFRFGSTNVAAADYRFDFGYDYNLLAPPAPGALGTTGLRATVNKKDTVPGAAGIDFYPVGQLFTNDFALRFNMLLVTPATATTEHALFGVCVSGSKTNWFRNSSGNVGNAWAKNMDGLWFAVNNSGGNLNDYTLFTQQPGTGANPLAISNRNAATVTQTFKPPLYSIAGSPGHPTSPQWIDVEVAKTTNMIALRLNNTLIIQTTNLTAFTSGTIMLGYNDAYDSIGGATGAVIYENPRVISITPPVILTQPVGGAATPGSSVTFSVVASTSTGVTNYQWLFKGVAIAGATSASLNVPDVKLANYGTYTVVVDDGRYPVSSDPAVLSPTSGPVINTQPTSLAGVAGGTATFSVAASTYTGVTNYQWVLNTTALTGRTNATLLLTNLQAANFGPYTVRVSDGLTTVTSAVATLSVAVQPSVSATLGAAAMTLGFSTEIGPDYVVEYKDALTDPTWLPLTNVAGTGAPISVTDSPLTAASRFYRIRMQ